MGALFIIFGVAIFLLFSRTVESGAQTTYVLTPGGIESNTPDWVFPTAPVLNIIGLFCIGVGLVQLIRGLGRLTNIALALLAGGFVFAFLTWATSGQSLNLAGLLNVSLSKAVPLTLGAMSGVLCERAGVVNIAIEGMMLAAAMTGALFASIASSLWIGLLAALIVGGLLGLFHAILSVRYLTNQIISGTVINIFAGGFTAFVSAKFMQEYPQINNSGIFPTFEIPILAKIPIIGPILFFNNIFVYGMFILLIVLTVALFSTRWGLRLRSVGEHPKAADTLGINVFRTRYMAVILGGMVAGFAGAYFSIGSAGRFDEFMTNGRGFISLAAMIFGNWTPFGSFGAGLLFGFAEALSSKLAILGVRIPSEFLLMTPYIVTMIVLAGVVGRSQMPAADGEPYTKE
jgi:simple sugar transport system permease protein